MHSVRTLSIFIEPERIQGSHGGEVEDTSAAILSFLDSGPIQSSLEICQSFATDLFQVTSSWYHLAQVSTFAGTQPEGTSIVQVHVCGIWHTRTVHVLHRQMPRWQFPESCWSREHGKDICAPLETQTRNAGCLLDLV